jgi:hypothetical protein
VWLFDAPSLLELLFDAPSSSGDVGFIFSDYEL